MSEVTATQAKPQTPRGDAAEKNVFAQIERWMALIREISLEQAKTNRSSAPRT